MSDTSNPHTAPTRRGFLGAAIGTAATLACNTAPAVHASSKSLGSTRQAVRGRPTLVGSGNGLKGMQQHYQMLVDGADPLDVAIEVVKTQEADPEDRSVGLGGLPNEDGVVQLDSAVMHGPTHNSGAVACIENILHPCEVARLVMERTDHCMIVGRGAYDFARGHGHAHSELLTEETRAIWMRWKESMSDRDDRLAPANKEKEAHG
ncbi:MAG: N4-(beta-N-acetylglucosaminyl)-L-asparaginase, partial [Planctomycetota bacterium]